jgi:hypothetical protein
MVPAAAAAAPGRRAQAICGKFQSEAAAREETGNDMKTERSLSMVRCEGHATGIEAWKIRLA